MPLGIVVISLLMLFTSLAVDLGRVQMTKSELQSTADAAARAAANGLFTSAAQARTDAITVAGQNIADGSSVVISNSDIDVGNWSGSAFTINGTPNNAVRVRVQRTAAANNAVPLLFARVFGQNSCDVRVTATATVTPGGPSGFIGLGSIDVKNNTFIGGYYSSVDTTPDQAGSQSGGAVGSNGAITAGNNNEVHGTVWLGSSASIAGVAVNGSTASVSTIDTPASPAWSPGTNPSGIAQNYTASSNTTLVGGTYWFTSLSVTATLQFSGPTTIYVNGDVNLSGALRPSSLIPSDLHIYQIGTHTFGNSDANDVDLVAVVEAPQSAFIAKNNLLFRGSGLFASIDVKNNAEFFYDQGSAGAGGMAVSLAE